MAQGGMTAAGGGRAWAIFAVCGLGFVLSQFYRVSVTVISSDLGRDLDLNPAQLGLMSSAFFYAFAAGQVPLLLALDRVGARRPMLILSLLALGGALLFGHAASGGQALWGRVLLGLGMSCNLMGALALVAAWFPPAHFATLSGLLVAIGYVGQLLANTPLAWLAQTWGWRWAFLAIAALHAAQTLALLLVARDRPAGQAAAPRRAGPPWRGMGEVLRLWPFWGICLGTFFRYGCFTALGGLWAGPFLAHGLGLGLVTTGNVLLVMNLGHILGLPLFGRLSDRVLRTRKHLILAGLMASSALTLGLGLLGPGQAEVWVFALFFAIGLAAAPGQIMYAHVKELVPPERQGAAMTGINLFTMLGPAMVIQAVGYVVDSGAARSAGAQGFMPAWWLLAGGLALAGLCYAFLPDSRPRQS